MKTPRNKKVQQRKELDSATQSKEIKSNCSINERLYEPPKVNYNMTGPVTIRYGNKGIRPPKVWVVENK